MFITFSLSAQDVEKCDTNILLSTSKRVGKLTQKEISDFLMTNGKECRSNVEYSEWSNELLFSILDQQTETILRVIDRGEKWLPMEEIFADLTHPNDETIVIKDLIQKINDSNIDPRLKNRIIDKLNAGSSRTD